MLQSQANTYGCYIIKRILSHLYHMYVNIFTLWGSLTIFLRYNKYGVDKYRNVFFLQLKSTKGDCDILSSSWAIMSHHQHHSVITVILHFCLVCPNLVISWRSQNIQWSKMNAPPCPATDSLVSTASNHHHPHLHQHPHPFCLTLSRVIHHLYSLSNSISITV